MFEPINLFRKPEEKKRHYRNRVKDEGLFDLAMQITKFPQVFDQINYSPIESHVSRNKEIFGLYLSGVRPHFIGKKFGITSQSVSSTCYEFVLEAKELLKYHSDK